MPFSLLNFRQPRAIVCLLLVTLLHGLVLLFLQVHPRKTWTVNIQQLELPTISLRLLPFVLQSAVTPVSAPSMHGKGTASRRSASAVPIIESAGEASSSSAEQASSEIPTEASTSSLNLNLSKRDWAKVTASKLPGTLPAHMTPGVWQQFVKTLGPPEEIKEERLSINRVRIHTKYGCYELEQTGTKRIDPLNWSPQYVTNCRY